MQNDANGPDVDNVSKFEGLGRLEDYLGRHVFEGSPSSICRNVRLRSLQLPRQSEICEFQNSLPIDKQILWFQISMENFVLVAFGGAVD